MPEEILVRMPEDPKDIPVRVPENKRGNLYEVICVNFLEDFC